MATWEVLFIAGVAFLAWTYVGFPGALALLGFFRPRPVRAAGVTPSVALVIAAFDEEEAIGAKLENALALDYPRGALTVIVASDGSTDRTEDVVAGFAPRGVRLLRLPRRGKVYALDAGVRATQSDILVFSDANTMFDRGALRSLVRSFADPEVGGVCGNQSHRRVRGADSSAAGESMYWSYDKILKRLESRCGSIVSADGAIYAIRRSLYDTPESAAVTDDFAISTAVIARGARLVFEPNARAWEPAASDARGEFQRKVRIMTRGWRGIWLRRSLLDPRRSGLYAPVFLCHKVLRRLAPIALAALAVAAAFGAAHDSRLRAAAMAQSVFYGAALLGAVLRRTRWGRHKLLLAPFFFCLANLAAGVALVRAASGRRIENWRPQRARVAFDVTPASSPRRTRPRPGVQLEYDRFASADSDGARPSRTVGNPVVRTARRIDAGRG